MIKKISLPSAIVELCIRELEEQEAVRIRSKGSFVQATKDELFDVNQKLDRLLDLHLSGSLTQTEYAQKKETLIMEKKDLEGKLSSLEQKKSDRFEPHTRRSSFENRIQSPLDFYR